MSRFTLPRDMYHGPGSLSRSQSSKEKSIRRHRRRIDEALRFLENARILREAGMRLTALGRVEPDPSVETVRRGFAEEMKIFSPRLIVAIGGGSSIDAAKAMWAFYEHPDISFESLCTPFSFPELRLISVRSRQRREVRTEVTAFSVITDYEKGIKYLLADFPTSRPMLPSSIPISRKTMPPKLAAHTGMDAFTHAVEDMFRPFTEFTDPLALRAISLFPEYLIDSFGGERTAREKMHYAQCLAGMAFSNALLGITHSMAHKTGAAFSGGHIVHGCANAMYLPKVIRFNSRTPEAKKRYADIARSLGLAGSRRRRARFIAHRTH